MYNTKILILLVIALLCGKHSSAQFAPQATLPGSDAIPASSTLFVAWADQCVVQRGYLDIAQPTLGAVSAGLPENATGSSDGSIVSLGDSGIAVLTFPVLITNGPGADFAVFENGFPNPANPAEAFLELAFVEVSSDGIQYFRFPPQSFTQVDSQLSSIAGQHYVDASKLYNLAGKYIGSYGVPFDLEELKDLPGLDVNQISHVRIVDVIGDIGIHGMNDENGKRINDPYPTAFPSGGFDLEAVGVLHAAPLSLQQEDRSRVGIYPNPARSVVHISLPEKQSFDLELQNAAGQQIIRQSVNGSQPINIAQLSPGIYFLHLKNEQQSCVFRLVKQ